jgi:hypothetical protein
VTPTPLLAQQDIDLQRGWEAFYDSVRSSVGTGLFDLLTGLGAVIVVVAILKWVWDKRRGGARSQGVLWAIVIGAIMAAPGLIIPVVLGIVDTVANAFVDLFDRAS